MIKSKCKVRFTAAEVDDSQSAAGRQVLEDIVDDFKIPVYLAELTVGPGENLSVRAHNAKLYEKIARCAIRNYILFCPVM